MEVEYTYENYPIGVDEVAKILGVKSATVSTWRARKSMPPADALINRGRTRLWQIKTIIDWASSTGRNPMDITYKQAHYIVASSEHLSSPSVKRWEDLAENWDRTGDSWRTTYNPFAEDDTNWDDLGKTDA